MILDFNNRIRGNRFLSEVIVTEPDSVQHRGEFESSCVGKSIEQCLSQGIPIIVCDAEAAVDTATRSALSFPIFCGTAIRSVLSFVVDLSDVDDQDNAMDRTGVFEVWTPRGLYQDLGLSSGYFGKLERFQNVSSFVRFERGSGLPGQAWSLGRTVIHDNLKTHPGFLRAAGASADALQTAIGIPVFANNFVSVVVLISGLAAPIARSFEVWQPTDEGFELIDRAYNGFDAEYQLAVGSRATGRNELLDSVIESQSAVLFDDVASQWRDRRFNVDHAVPSPAVAIPTYAENELSCVTVLVL